LNKKLLYTFAIIAILILILPIVGNKTLNATIDSYLTTLKNQGISYRLRSDTNNYFMTQKSYIFKIADRKKFLHFVATHSQEELPAILVPLLTNLEIGVDVEFANIPIMNKISLNLYPQKLLKNESIHTQTFLKEKKLLYHLDYDIVSMHFESYLRDCNESLRIAPDKKIAFVFKNIALSGDGFILHPQSFKNHINRLLFKTQDISLDIKNMLVEGNVQSKFAYLFEANIEKCKMQLKENRTNFILNKGYIKAQSHLNAKSISLEYKLKSDTLGIDFTHNRVRLKNFVFENSMSNINKTALHQVENSVSRYQDMPDANTKQSAINDIVRFLSYGLEFSINKFAFDETVYNNEKLGALSAKLDLDVHPDKNLVQKINAKKNVLKNIDMDLHVAFAQKLFSTLKTYVPVMILLENRAEQKNGNYLYNLRMHKGSTTLNGRAF